MKKTILLLLAGLFGGNIAALADTELANKLTPFEKQQIAWALRVLTKTKTLVISENQCAQLDEDILNVLESEGRIERGGTRPSIICIGPGQITK